jgi:methylenetetrahydrofolate reductase (NADPH)
MSRKLIDEALIEAKKIGVRNILALRGDPPRNEEYGVPDSSGAANGAQGDGSEQEDEEKWEFVWAVDLVRYIRKKHGDYFCVGVAAYPDGHADQSHPEKQDPEFDLPYLREKTKAGADFIMTQLFFDQEQYRKYESMLRNDESGIFKSIPIILGLMPIQSYQIIRRTTKLSHAKVPPALLERLDAVRGDDEEVKRVGVDIISEIVEGLRDTDITGRRGYHFYTLNLEKAVSQIVERCNLISDLDIPEHPQSAVFAEPSPSISSTDSLQPDMRSFERRRLSSVNAGPRNRVVVEKVSAAWNADYEALETEAGVPTDDQLESRKTALAISEGEGSLGREATWDDFPNGRFGDARSPGESFVADIRKTKGDEEMLTRWPAAFGEIDGYGVSLHVSIPEAIRLWGYPVDVGDISQIFLRHVDGTLRAIPWSEEDFNPETFTIKDQLMKLNLKGWWTVASQPAVDGVPSTHSVFGWGPKSGFVFQKVSS